MRGKLARFVNPKSGNGVIIQTPHFINPRSENVRTHFIAH